MLKENEASPDPLRQNPLFIRHGSRQLIQGFPNSVPESRICMDITSIFLSMHLGLLNLVRESFHPIGIAEDVVPALIDMRDRISHHQPKRIEVFEQIIRLVDAGSLKVVECQLPPNYENSTLVKEVGEEWAALLEYAVVNNGYLVDFFPVRRGDVSGRPACLPDNVLSHLVYCRSIVESLRKEGPLSGSEYDKALEALGDQGLNILREVIPKQGTFLVCRGNIPEVLANTNLLHIICDRFNVGIEKRELEVVKAELGEYKKRLPLIDWLARLIYEVSKGISDGTYEILTKKSNREKKTDEESMATSTSKCLFTLLSFEPRETDVIWSDDRYVNSYLRRDNIPIIGINEILKALVSKGSLGLKDYYEKIEMLRAANTRFIPVLKEEIMHHVKEAGVINGKLVETRSLSIIRRYIAACLYEGHLLQRPPMPEGSPNERGELDFIISLFREINESIGDVWANLIEDEKTCQARADWLMENLYIDHNGALKTLSIKRSQEDEQYLEAIGLSGLIIHGITFLPFGNIDRISAQRKYFKWASDRILKKRFNVNPSLIVAVAEYLKKFFADLQREMEKKGTPREERELLQVYYEALPNQIKEELKQDAAFMSVIGLKTILITEIGGLKFNANDFLPAVAEAINGRNAEISTIDLKVQISIYPSDDLDKGSVCFNDPVTGEKKQFADNLYEVLNESPTKREAVLRKNRPWFDCSNMDLEKAIAEIASTEGIQQRFERTLSWKNSSASVYYEEISQELINHREFQFSKGLPPSADGMLRHLRFDIDFEPDSSFQTSLAAASQKLFSEEGLFETITRLSGLPVPLPSNLIGAIQELPPGEGHRLVKRLVRISGSPVSKIHFIHILIRMNNNHPIYHRLAKRIAVSLLNSEGLEDFKAFLALFKWINEEFGHCLDIRQWPVPLRLAMIWTHSSRLYAIFKSAGVSVTEIFNIFEERRQRLPFEIFERDLEYWYDISHPRHVNRASFLLTGLFYAFGDKIQNNFDRNLQDLITPLITLNIDGTTMPGFALLKDTMLAKNTLNSFLAMSRGETLFSFFGHESTKGFKRKELLYQAEQAIERLSTSTDNPPDWAILHAIIGDFPSPEES